MCGSWVRQLCGRKCHAVRGQNGQSGWRSQKGKVTQINTGYIHAERRLKCQHIYFSPFPPEFQQLPAVELFFFLLNYLLHSLTLWSRKRNSTKHFQKEKKRKWGRTRFHSLTTDWIHAEPWITSFQHSGRLQVGAFHLAEVMPSMI